MSQALNIGSEENERMFGSQIYFEVKAGVFSDGLEVGCKPMLGVKDESKNLRVH